MSSIVASVTGQRGGNSGGAGLNYNAAGANVLNPATVDQANAQYTNTQDAIARQKAFVDALHAQNGLGNQSNVFNTLQNVANGQGPNPAQAMLDKATGENVAGTTAAIASARGASSNPALAARTAAMVGANAGQKNAADSATMQANQSLNAINSMGGIASQQVGNESAGVNALNANVQGEQGQILNSINGQNSANVGMTSNQNTANAGIAGIAAQGQQHLISNIAGGLGSAFMAEGGKVNAAPRMYADGTTDVAAPQIPPVPGAPSAAPNKPGPQSRVGRALSGMSQEQNSANPYASMDKSGQTIGKGVGKGVQAIGSGISSLFAPATATSDGGILRPATKNEMIMNTGGKFGDPVMGEQRIPGTEGGGYTGNGYGDRTGVMAGQDQGPQAMAGGAADASDATMGNAINGSAGDLTTALPADVSDLGQQLMGADGGLISDLAKIAPILMAARGGKVPALLSPGERYLPPQEAKAVKAGKKDPLKAGVKVPGTPMYPGNDLRNDVVPAKLDKGGLVIPNEVLQSKSPHFAAMRFVHAHMMAKGGVVGKKRSKK